MVKTKKELEEEIEKLKKKLENSNKNKRSFTEELVLARERNKKKHSIGLGTLILGKILGYDKIGRDTK